MSDLLWQKPGVETDAQIMRFLAGDDIVLDREFFLYDITASKVHVEGLQRIGILTVEEGAALTQELDELGADFARGAFVLDERFEDGHSAIEARLTERLGDTGRKLHTGRSRNDQILVATRLWLKDKLLELTALCRAVARVCLERAAHEALALPGYTHLQRAVVSSTAMWFAGFAEAFVDNALRARDTLAWVDTNPLGTAAGYGVNLKLDRDQATRALGFSRLQVSPVYAQLSRGKFEIAALEALGSATLDLRRLAWDLSLFTTAEFNFVRLPAQYTTGSSIMPNKRNPDVIELLRATHASVAAARSEIEQLRCRRAISATCSSPRAAWCMVSRAGSPRCACCPICCRDCNGTKPRCVRQSSRPCMRLTSRSNKPWPACRFAKRISALRKATRMATGRRKRA